MKLTMLYLLPLVIIMRCFIHNHTQVCVVAKAQDGYYHGSDRLFTSVFLKIENDTAIADFIFFQKFPRELLTDTLVYSDSNYMFLGRISNLILKKGNYYICTNDSSTIFDKKIEIKITLDEAYYKKHIDEYKNYAVWHECYKEYLNSTEIKDKTSKYFNEMGKKYLPKSMIDTLNHNDFLEELEKFKSALKNN